MTGFETTFAENLDLDYQSINAFLGTKAVQVLQDRPIFAEAVPLKEIIESSPMQTRAAFDPARCEADRLLTDSIREKGILSPVGLKIIPAPGESSQAGFGLVYGHRRVQACTYLEIRDLPALVYPAAYSEAQLAEFTVIENQQRQDLAPLELAAQVKRMQERFGLSVRGLAALFAISKSQLHNLLTILDAPLCIQDLIADGLLGVANAMRVLRELNPDQQALFERRLRSEQAPVTALLHQLASPPDQKGRIKAPGEPVNRGGGGGLVQKRLNRMLVETLLGESLLEKWEDMVLNDEAELSDKCLGELAIMALEGESLPVLHKRHKSLNENLCKAVEYGRRAMVEILLSNSRTGARESRQIIKALIRSLRLLEESDGK